MSFEVPDDGGVDLRHHVEPAAVVRVQGAQVTLPEDRPVQRASCWLRLIELGVMRPSVKTLDFTKVGHSTVTAMSVPSSSAARVSDSDITPAFDTL